MSLVLSRLSGVKKNGQGYKALCPAHDDVNPSLSIHEGEDGTVLLKCFAGCDNARILEAIDLTYADLYPAKAAPLRETVTSYRYVNELGELLFETVRYVPKDFRQRRPDGIGGWIWNLNGTRRVLYRLPEVLGAVAQGRRIFVVEGEKDADALVRRGEVATCNPMGAKSWRAEYAQFLAKATVTVVADRDDEGRRWAHNVATDLLAAACVVDVVEANIGKDATDHFDAGFGVDDFVPVEISEPAEEPSALVDVRVVCVADVEPEAVEWLWYGRLPRAMPTVLDGDPGLGKSTLTLDLAAAVSAGQPMPDGQHLAGAQDVVLLSAEDGIAQVIRPRLEAAGADLTRVHVLEEVIDSSGPCPPSIPADLPRLEAVIRRWNAGLVVIDPLNAYLGAKVDSYRDQDVRRALHPLAEVAARTKAAVLIVRHLSKSGGPNALYRGGGSIGIIGAARTGLLVAPDPDDESRRLLAVTKCNLAPIADTIAYRLVPAEGHDCARIKWEGATAHRANDLLHVPTDDDDRTARDDAKDFLSDYLKGGRQPAKDVRKDARAAGISDRTLDRAKRDLKVSSPHDGFGAGSTWYWELPESHTSPPDPIDRQPKTWRSMDEGGDLCPKAAPTDGVSDLPLTTTASCRVCHKTTVTGDARGPVHRECLSLAPGDEWEEGTL